MDIAELTAAVEDAIDDPSFTPEAILALLNRGLKIVASGVMLPGRYQLSPPLPDLYTVGPVDTVADSGVCELPENFGRNVVLVVNANSDTIKLVDSFKAFLRGNPRKAVGSVRICTAHGSKLLYRDLPSTPETLDIHYYAKPEEMEDEDDSPDCIPEHLHHDILVGYACKEAYNLIEDGIDGQKVSTKYWTGIFEKGIHELGLFIGEDGEAQHYEPDSGDYID